MTAPVSDPHDYAPVSRRYRQWLAGASALALHALVLAGVAGLTWSPPPPEPPPAIDVVLTRQPAVEPQAARAIAEAAQTASGPESTGHDTPAAPSPPPAPESASSPPPPASPAATDSPAPPPEPTAPDEPAVPSEPPPAPAPEPAPAPDSAPPPPSPDEPPKPRRDASAASGRDLLAQATSSVRERGFDAAPAGGGEGDASQRAARKAAEARYEEDWTRRVETYGNRFYPAPPNLDGQLRIRVVIGRDGQLRQAEVIQSSGKPRLDQAALDTVRGAAPYRPFDKGMGARDSLTITRVWRYGKGNNFGVR